MPLLVLRVEADGLAHPREDGQSNRADHHPAVAGLKGVVGLKRGRLIARPTAHKAVGKVLDHGARQETVDRLEL